MNIFLNNSFGWATLVLVVIPLAILVRIFVKTSSWSILKVGAVSISGTLLLFSWLFYASLITGINLGGEWGKAVGQWLADVIGDSSAFYLLSAGLFICIILASLDLIISVTSCIFLIFMNAGGL